MSKAEVIAVFTCDCGLYRATIRKGQPTEPQPTEGQCPGCGRPYKIEIRMDDITKQDIVLLHRIH